MNVEMLDSKQRTKNQKLYLKIALAHACHGKALKWRSFYGEPFWSCPQNNTLRPHAICYCLECWGWFSASTTQNFTSKAVTCFKIKAIVLRLSSGTCPDRLQVVLGHLPFALWTRQYLFQLKKKFFFTVCGPWWHFWIKKHTIYYQCSKMHKVILPTGSAVTNHSSVWRSHPASVTLNHAQQNIDVTHLAISA